MMLRLVLLLLLAVLLREAGAVNVSVSRRQTGGAGDGGLLSIIDKVPKCAVSTSPMPG